MNIAPARSEIAPPPDPLLVSVPMTYRARFYPYGFAATVKSNSPAVIDAARESWAGLKRLFHERPVEVRCLVSEATERCCPPPPTVRAQRNLMAWSADAENFWSCDLAAGFGTAWITEGLAADRRYLRFHVLEAMATTMLEMLHMCSLHAACVAHNGRGVLLAGDSGAGKTSMAYACARRGWTYIADDCSTMARHGRTRTVVGDPRLFRFRASVGALFPEFQGFAESPFALGKPTIEVRTSALPAIRTAVESRVDAIVFLNRNGTREGQAVLSPLAAEEALERLAYAQWPPELPAARSTPGALTRLVKAPAYELRYKDLDAAVDKLEETVCGGIG